jgi:hypothetical protein
MRLNKETKRSKFDLTLAIIALLMTPYGYAGELTMRSKNIPPLYTGTLCLICSMVLFVRWYKSK